MNRQLAWSTFAVLALSFSCARAARAEADPKQLYDVTFKASPKVKKGETGTLTVKITPKNGGELHDETPLSLKVHGPDEVSFSKSAFSRPDAKVTPEATSIEAPFTAKAHGKGTIDADLSFVICNPSNCFRQTVKGTAKVAVE